MDCPEPMSQGDEEVCPKCSLRWGKDETRPVCMKQRLASKKAEMISPPVESKIGKRFLVFGGYVTGNNGVYVTAQKLPALYGVDPSECVFYRDGMRESDYKELMHLGPLSLGGYAEFLARAKVEQFHDYVKQKALREHNSRRTEGRHLVPTHDKRIAMYEARWPEFPAAYKRWTER